MKKYEWVLFDADDTLFNFDAYTGLQVMFSQYGVEFTQTDFAEYQLLNKSLWKAYQDGTTTTEYIRNTRFQLWSERLQVSSIDLNSAFMSAMATVCNPLDGAVNLLEFLCGKAKLGIITNGLTELQQARLEKTQLKKYFDLLVVSEEVGVAKPHKDIFDHALKLMGNPSPENVLMVGDNPDSDILGGINAGFDTCWLNVNSKATPPEIIPKYQVPSLIKLENLLAEMYII